MEALPIKLLPSHNWQTAMMKMMIVLLYNVLQQYSNEPDKTDEIGHYQLRAGSSAGLVYDLAFKILTQLVSSVLIET
jgi:hypothetical protein